MTNKIKASFDGIRAGDKLKSDTLLYLRRETARRKRTPASAKAIRYAFALAAVVLLAVSGVSANWWYFTPVTYVDMDVNPSIALALNRFDRVIETRAYNGDGDDMLSQLSLAHKSYGEALAMLIDAMNAQGYFQRDAFVSVTWQTEDKKKEEALSSYMQADIARAITGRLPATQIDIFPVSGDTRSHSSAADLSPAKYLAIQALIAVDPTASLESCRDHSLTEIKQLAQAHGSHHASGSDEAAANPAPKGGHHGGGERGHHGGR